MSTHTVEKLVVRESGWAEARRRRGKGVRLCLPALPERDRAWVDALAVPHPIGTTTEKMKFTGARDRIARKTYIRASGYPNVSFEKAHARAKAEGWRTYEVHCGHDVMIDEPDRLTEILLEAG